MDLEPHPSQENRSKQPQGDTEDLSFLDDIDVDLIANCLNSCKDPANSYEHNNTSKYIASPSTKDDAKWSIEKHRVKKGLHGKNSMKQDAKYSFIAKHKVAMDSNVFMLKKQLEKTLYHVYKEDYHISPVHIGKHSLIMKCKDVVGDNFAVKILKQKTIYYGEAKQTMLLEVQKNISKENLFCIFFKPGFPIDTRWCFVMDYYPVTLKEAMQQLNKPLHIYKVQALAIQLLSAVDVLHTNDIVHSDIKPSHILIDSTNENLRLCGFDDAYYKGAVKVSANVGSLNYRAPEIILGYSYGFSIDVWSTAVVLVEMITDAAVFRGYSNNDILYKQMCTFGPIPNEMIEKSKHQAQHFSKNMFKRITETGIEYEHMDIFHKPCGLNQKMLRAQTCHWRDYDEKQRKRYMKKLNSFNDLLEQMMAIVPEDRCTIRDAYELFVKFIYLPEKLTEYC